MAHHEISEDLAAEDWAIADRADLDRVRAIITQVPDPLVASWSRILSVAGRTTKARPGELVLRPEPGSEPGAVPWIRRWAVVLDGERIGTAQVSTDGDGSTRLVEVPDEHREAAREALFHLLLDPRAPTP